jgi:hypothetical protein
MYYGTVLLGDALALIIPSRWGEGERGRGEEREVKRK